MCRISSAENGFRPVPAGRRKFHARPIKRTVQPAEITAERLTSSV